MNIGIFDSGIGGLAILKKLIEYLPQYNYVYLADNANLPYGQKSPEEIYIFTKNAIDFLFKKDCDLIIIACNTAVTTSLRTIQQNHLPILHPDKHVLGVTRPAMESAIEHKARCIGVLATVATVNSNSFFIELQKLHAPIPVFQQACPELASYIEENAQDEILIPILKKYLQPLIEKNIDTLILGCTHYELIVNKIRDLIPPSISIITEGGATAEKLKDYLKRHPEIEKTLSKNSLRIFYATKEDSNYPKIFAQIMGKEFNSLEIISSSENKGNSQ